MTTLWCFDPGQTTGIAKFIDNNLVFWDETRLWVGIDQLIQPGNKVVYESVFWNHPSFKPIGIEVVGVIKYLCELYQITPTPQSPGSLVGPRTWPIYTFSSVKSQHAVDAICHGIFYLKGKVTLPDVFLT